MYRAYAAECLRLAGEVSTPHSRAMLVEMAHTWHRMAQDLEQAEQWAERTGQLAERNGQSD